MGTLGLLAKSLTTDKSCVTFQKSKYLDYTEAECLKSRLADLLIFLRLFSNIFNIAATHRLKIARPGNKLVTITHGDCRETYNNKPINLYASPKIAVIAETWRIAWLRKTHFIT
jgi:hypothetical protein